jgi:hypothetical protein
VAAQQPGGSLFDRFERNRDSKLNEETPMFELAKRTIEFLDDLPPAAIIGALLLALVIAVTTAVTFRWLAGRKPDAFTLLVCLVLLANLACILATVGYVHSTVPTLRLIERGGWPARDRIINVYDHVAQPESAIESGVSSAPHP